MPGVGVPQLEGDRLGHLAPASQSDRPTSSLPTSCASSSSSARVKRGRGRLVALRQPDRERVEQHVHRARPVRDRPGAARAASAAASSAAGGIEIIRPQRRHERLQVRLAGQANVKRRQASGGAQQQRSRVAAALLLQRDLPAQVLRLRRRVGVQLLSLECDQQPERRVERAGIPLRPGSREQAFPAAGGFGRQLGGALEERGRRSQAPARLRPAAERSSSSATSSSGPAAAWARCQAWRSGSISGSVTAARARCTSCRSCSDADG